MEQSNDLTPAEQKYFETGGETSIEETKDTQSQEPTQEQAPDNVEQPQGEGGEGESQKTVPYAALAQERAKRKELQRQLQEREVELARASEARRIHESLLGGNQPQQQQPINPVDRLAHLEQFVVEQAQNQQALQELSQFGNYVVAAEQQFMSQNPDYDSARKHYWQMRASQLKAMGIPEDRIVEAVNTEAIVIAQNAISDNENPAQRLYEIAKIAGFRPQAANQNEATRLAIFAKGQSAAKSLSNVGGGATPSMSLDALANMSDKEFAKATQGDNWEKMWH